MMINFLTTTNNKTPNELRRKSAKKKLVKNFSASKITLLEGYTNIHCSYRWTESVFLLFPDINQRLLSMFDIIMYLEGRWMYSKQKMSAYFLGPSLKGKLEWFIRSFRFFGAVWNVKFVTRGWGDLCSSKIPGSLLGLVFFRTTRKIISSNAVLFGYFLLLVKISNSVYALLFLSIQKSERMIG